MTLQQTAWAMLIPLTACAQMVPTVTGVVNSATKDNRLSPGLLAFVRYWPSNLPIDAATLSIQVGGRPAWIQGFREGEIAARLPWEVPPGPTTLTLTTAAGRSDPFNITLSEVAPTLYDQLPLPCPPIGDRPLAVSALGLGPTEPRTTDADTPSPPPPWRQTVAQPVITVGGRSAKILYAVLINPNYGAYTVAFELPPGLPDGEHQLILTIAGTSSNPMRIRIGTTITSAATFEVGPIAAESIVTALRCGSPLAARPEVASGPSLPLTLGGTTVTFSTATGEEASAPLYFVSPAQVNFVTPASLRAGEWTATIRSENGAIYRETVRIERVAPALFTKGLMAPYADGLIVRRRDGVQILEPLVTGTLDDGLVHLPIDLGPQTDRVSLVLFATGIRFRTDPSSVRVRLGHMELPVEFAEPRPGFPGLDHISVALPSSLPSGSNSVQVSVDGQASNVAYVLVK